jgi:hypothetical protein
MSSSPSFQDKYYTKRVDNWNKMAAFRVGIDSVKALLNKWERESVEGFKARQKSATLYNVVKKTVKTSNGLLFRKSISWSDDLNKDFLEKAKDIDNADSNLNEFTKGVTESALWMGVSYILVDLPKSEEIPETMQQQRDLGLIPYFSKIEANQIVNRRVENNELTQITIREVVTEYDGEFGEKEIEQFRVLFIGGGRIYRGDTIVHQWVTNLTYIPIIPVYTNKEGFFDGSSKFIDIADLNLKHFNFQSQLDKTLFIAANPIPKIWGATDKESMTVGVDQALTWKRKEDGDFVWEEFKGTSVDKLQVEIENTEKRMATIGLSMLVQNEKEVTATERIIDSTSENSDLSSISDGVEWALNVAYSYWCDFLGVAPTGAILTNKDFTGIALTPEQAKTYLEMFNAGTLTLDQLWDELQRQEFIADFDRDLAKAELEAKNQNVDLGGTPINK